MDENLALLMPHDKHNTERALALIALGWERVKPVMPQALEWIQDMNWPVARVFQPFFVDAGERLGPFLKTVFASSDDIWKYSVLEGVVSKSPKLADILRDELERLANSPTPSELLEGVTEQARLILQK